MPSSVPAFQESRKAFTLIELLVVVTIIVILLALLMPALDKAIYEAELVKCASNQKGIATGAVSYAFSNNKFFMYRPAIEKESTITYKPLEDNKVYSPGYRHRRVNTLMEAGIDDRRPIQEYVALKNFLDPMSGEGAIDLSTTAPETAYVYADYAIFFGMKWDRWGAMRKMGRKMLASGHFFTVMASDLDIDGGGLAEFTWRSSHPDKEGRMQQMIRNNSGGYLDAGWIMSDPARARSPIDFNEALWDGSVHQFRSVRAFEWADAGDAADEDRVEDDPNTYTHKFTDMTWQANGDWGRGAIQVWKEDGENENTHNAARKELGVNP